MKLKKLVSVLAVVALVGVGLGLAQTMPAQASPDDAVIYVTTTNDEYDMNGTGAGCSLREAIHAANTDAAFGGCPA